MSDAPPQKPVARPTAASAPFWDAAAEGKLLYQFCGTCNRAQHYPRALCSHCGALDLTWRESAAKGVVHAVTRVHVGLSSFQAGAPYSIVLVDIDEGFRMLMNISGDDSDIAVGRCGEVVFELLGGVQMPQFQPASR